MKYWILPANVDDLRVDTLGGKKKPFLWSEMRVGEQSKWSNIHFETGEPKRGGTPKMFREVKLDDVLLGYEAGPAKLTTIAQVLKEPYQFGERMEEQILEFEIVAQLRNPINKSTLESLGCVPIHGTPLYITNDIWKDLREEIKNFGNLNGQLLE